MAYAPNLGVNGTLVLIRTIAGSTSASFSMQVSTDRGTSFSNVTLDFSNLGQRFSDVIWSEDDQLFVGLSKFDATHEVYTSTNGSSWTRRVTPAPLTAFAFYSRIVFSPSLGTYYVKQNGTGAASEHITSTDGTTWSTWGWDHTAPGSDQNQQFTLRELLDMKPGQYDEKCYDYASAQLPEGDGNPTLDYLPPGGMVAAKYTIKLMGSETTNTLQGASFSFSILAHMTNEDIGTYAGPDPGP